MRDFIDCDPKYTPVFFTSPTEAQTEHMHQIKTRSKTKGLKTIHKISTRTLPVCKLLKYGSAPKIETPHIWPLWNSQPKDFDVQQIDCEVDTGAGCNILLVYKVKVLFGQEWLDCLQPPTVYIEAHGGKPVHNLGSCIVYLHNGKQTFRVLCQVTDTNGYFILGSEQAQQMNCIS